MRKVLYFFGILDDADIEWMANTGARLDVPPGTVLIREGIQSDALFLVLDGSLGIRVAAVKDREVARLLPGEIVGEMSFVDSRPPSASVETSERALVLSLPRQKVSEKLNGDIPFAARFYRAIAVTLADRLRTMTQSSHGDGNEPREEQEELDFDVLEKLSLAGTRFDNLHRRVRAGVNADV
jgi:CRP/FNR family transcriptional regulator, cyclic AMP receptor protein